MSRGFFVGFLIYIIFLHFRPSTATLKTYDGERICDRTIYLGTNKFGIKIDFYSSRLFSRPCVTDIQVAPGYSSAYYIRTMKGNCGSQLSVNYSVNQSVYTFCNYIPTYPFEKVIPPFSNVSLRIANDYNQLSTDQFFMIFYVFRKNKYHCDLYSLRCNNGRCLDRELFCDTSYDFCDDSTYKDCYNDIQYADKSSSFGNVIGVVALIVTLCLVFIVIGYFCCYRSKRLNAAARARDTRTTRCAPDIFTLSVSQENADVIDYVIDYQKFIEPPPYHTLELTIPTQSAQAHTTDTSGMAETEFNTTGPGHDSTEYTDLQNGSRLIDRNDNNATEVEGRTNQGHEPEDDGLPSYNDVVTNEERFNVDSVPSRISSTYV